MGKKIIQGDLHIQGRLWQNEEAINVLLTDYTNMAPTDAVFITSIANDQKLTIIKMIKEITGWGLKEAKEFLESTEIGTDLKTHSYNGLQLTEEQLVELVTQATAQRLMTFAGQIGDEPIAQLLKNITITEDKKSIIFNDTTEILLEGSSVEVKRFI